ncbi:MAG TPA: hypothetical protein VFU23_05655 [Gemmatimonadales bacterium]|nr:hypothetical protein [Gemmatimonadales bacterium]
MRLLNGSLRTLAVVAMAVACKKAPPPVEQAPPPPPPAPVAMASVDLGKAIGPDKRVTAPLTTFGPRDTIYASVATTGVSTGATLTAKWTFQTGQMVDSTTQSIAPTGPGAAEFHIMKKGAWPAGKYKVSILLNAAQTIEKEFEIKR